MIKEIHGWRVLVIPDCHIPFEDKKAYSLMLAVANSLRGLKELVLLGDFADFYDVNSHGKDPSIPTKLKEERAAVCKRLKQLATLFPNTKRVFIEGNHCYRLERYLASNAPELFDVVRIDEFLALDRYGFEYIPYGPDQQYKIGGTNLIARHEPIGGGLHCAHSTITKAGKSVIFGHTHRLQTTETVSLDGDYHVGISSGWLGDKSLPAFKYVKNHHQWGLGFTIINVLSNGMWFYDLVKIQVDKEGRYFCVVDGDFYYEDIV